jgi:hypothetical protein
MRLVNNICSILIRLWITFPDQLIILFGISRDYLARLSRQTPPHLFSDFSFSDQKKRR